MPNASKQKRPAALSREAVVEAIREGILKSDLAPGQRLVEAELCESLGASRGAVRAALMDLVHEGLVEQLLNRSARVRVVSLQEALHLAEGRMVVEGLCVARAAERITDQEIETMRATGKEMELRAEQDDAVGFAELTHKLFDHYVRIADQPVAAEILNRLRDRNSHHRFRLTYRADRPRVAMPLWRDIIDAICLRDPKGARKALERHANNVQEAMKALAEDRNILGVR